MKRDRLYSAVIVAPILAAILCGSVGLADTTGPRDTTGLSTLIAPGGFEPPAVTPDQVAASLEEISAQPAPLPSTVAMGLLGLTVCAAGLCRRGRRAIRRNRASS